MILYIVFGFIEFSIIFGAFNLMGQLGRNIFDFNFKAFGIFAFIHPLIILYMLYTMSKNQKITSRHIEVCLASFLLFLLLLILQSSLLQYGVIGEAIVNHLLATLGSFGIILSSLFGICVCLLVICDINIITLFKETNFSQIKSFMSFSQKRFVWFFKSIYNLSKQKITNFKEKRQNLKLQSQKELVDFFENDTQAEKPAIIHNTPVNQQYQEEEEVSFNDEIKIQEYIIVEPTKKIQHKIKMLDDNIQPTKKENPFAQEDFSRHQSKTISTSLELLQKIRNENKLIEQKQEPIQEKPHTPTQKINRPRTMPKTLQSLPPLAPTQSQPNPNPIEETNNTYQEECIQDIYIQEPLSAPLDILTQTDVPPIIEIEPSPIDHLDLIEEQENDDIEIQNQETDYPEIQDQNPVKHQDVAQNQYTEIGNKIQNTENIAIEEEVIQPNVYSAAQVPDKVEETYHQYDENNGKNTQIASHTLDIPNTILQKSSPKVSSLAENEALLNEIDKGEREAPKDYALPPLSLLSPAPEQESTEFDEGEIDQKIENLLEKLSVFKIDGDVTRTYSGPIITTLEFRPAPNVKVSRIQSLENDIAMALEAKSIRIQAPIPGKSVVGIEIPNTTIQTIYLREIFESEIFKNSASPLTLALGKDVVGNPFVTDLKKLPHLLIAGTTGSGKSVGVNAMILSLLYRNSPEDLKLMMVDPKMVEFMPYTDLPHLITPIITDPKKAVIGLANAVKEMERRYTLMSQSRTKEIVSYNQKAQELGLEKFPYFVIIIDELADLMMTAGKEVEYSMARIAQMGRASGMHLIVATQSPRAEVLTGLIKTNLPAHLSYKVGTKIDASIIGCPGAETLLGRGDMLFTPPGVSGLVRLHAPWSSEDEVNEIVSYIKEQREVMYDPLFSPEERESLGAMDNTELDSESAELIDRAKEVILQDGKTSISYIQRRLGIGYNKAADVMEKLEQMGFVSAPNSKGAREVLG